MTTEQCTLTVVKTLHLLIKIHKYISQIFSDIKLVKTHLRTIMKAVEFVLSKMN